MIHNSRGPNQVIVYENRCISINAQLAQNTLHHLFAVGIKGAYRFIHNQDIRLHRQYGGNAYRLPLAA